MEPFLQVMCMKLAQNWYSHHCCWWASEFQNIWRDSGYSSSSWSLGVKKNQTNTESCYPMNSLGTNSRDWKRMVCFTRMYPHTSGKWKTCMEKYFFTALRFSLFIHQKTTSEEKICTTIPASRAVFFISSPILLARSIFTCTCSFHRVSQGPGLSLCSRHSNFDSSSSIYSHQKIFLSTLHSSMWL